jgi:hypothetical protein
MPTCPAATEHNDGDKRPKDGPSKVTTVNVGQGEPLPNLLTVIHKPIKAFFDRIFRYGDCQCALQTRAAPTGQDD